MVSRYIFISKVSIIIETNDTGNTLRGTFANFGNHVAPQHHFC
jgi:hypothetical protein